MNQKGVNEIRRRLTADRHCIGKIYGCYVNHSGEIISRIEESMALMPQDEAERYLHLLQKTLSGGVGRCLMDLAFSTEQVNTGEEHKLLTALRASMLKDEDAREQLYQKIIANTPVKEDNYLILLAADAYDVPRRTKDGEGYQEDSEETFRYILCAVCPVSDGKTELGYIAGERGFHNFTSPQTVDAPEVGFMFPAFEDRRTNIYGALYYSKNTADIHETLMESLFRTEIPMSAGMQKETFHTVLAETLEEACSFEVVQSVHEQIRERITVHKESKDPDPLDFDASDVGTILLGSGVPEERVQSFRDKCRTEFGDGPLNPTNIIDPKKFHVVTPHLKITVSPESSYLLETTVIGGRRYLLIPAEEGVEINGLAVHIPKE